MNGNVIFTVHETFGQFIRTRIFKSFKIAVQVRRLKYYQLIFFLSDFFRKILEVLCCNGKASSRTDPTELSSFNTGLRTDRFETNVHVFYNSYTI